MPPLNVRTMFRSAASSSRRYASTSALRKDWSSTQYLKFNSERTRPSIDLLSQVPLSSPSRIVDLGCGPGNSTQILCSFFPEANISGMDSSADMIAKARSDLPQIDFSLGDLTTYEPEQDVDLFFCNAVLQWLSQPERRKVLKKMIENQRSGSCFAFQVPNNLQEPSHVLMRTVATRLSWVDKYGDLPIRAEIESPQELYDQVIPYCKDVNIWQTNYQHVLENHEAIVEWVKGTGLRPFIDPLSPAEETEYLAEYLKELKAAYPSTCDGKVIFNFPRLFLVATRK
ncbi:trans-aconitate 2-methyltransferase [Paramyrothecium foliicola]|nr:trans-aconitate 2-methyltransferase [Paramyrothecium foliicola]